VGYRSISVSEVRRIPLHEFAGTHVAFIPFIFGIVLPLLGQIIQKDVARRWYALARRCIPPLSIVVEVADFTKRKSHP
jgi:hypothetical protein